MHNTENNLEVKKMCKIKIENLIKRYGDNKETEKQLKAALDADNKAIKQHLQETGLTTLDGAGYSVKLSESVCEGFDEDKLIEVLLNTEIASEVIKTRKYVDMEALEDAVYNGKIAAALLADCKTRKVTTKLLISKTK